MAHTSRCEAATTASCKCSCEGVRHGLLDASFWDDDVHWEVVRAELDDSTRYQLAAVAARYVPMGEDAAAKAQLRTTQAHAFRVTRRARLLGRVIPIGTIIVVGAGELGVLIPWRRPRYVRPDLL